MSIKIDRVKAFHEKLKGSGVIKKEPIVNAEAEVEAQKVKGKRNIKDQMTYIRLESGLYDKVKASALAQGMTLSGLVRLLVEAYMYRWEKEGERIFEYVKEG